MVEDHRKITVNRIVAPHMIAEFAAQSGPHLGPRTRHGRAGVSDGLQRVWVP
jgi:hypothetical protein